MKDTEPTPSEAQESLPEEHSLLEELSLLEEKSAEKAEPLDDDLLRAYREGALDVESSTSLEKRLLHDASGRARLAELSGQALPEPSPFLKARVLKAYRREQPSRRWLPWAVAALLILSISGLFLRSGDQPLPAALEYHVTAEGLASVRSAEPTRLETLEARPQTVLRWTLAPTGEAESDVSFGLYREDGDGWSRVERGLELEISRGVAVMSAPAELVVGQEPGSYTLWLVAGRPGDLPARLSTEQLSDPGSRWRSFRQSLVLLP